MKDVDLNKLIPILIAALVAIWIVCSAAVQCNQEENGYWSAYDRGRLRAIEEMGEKK